MKDKKERLHIHLGRSNLSATIFVPFDCDNNCRFCTSKESYRLRIPNLEKVLKKIQKLNKIDWVKSFVLTGGEPFADLDMLQIILDAISPRKKIYVNTTLPTNRYSEEELIEFINNSCIDGINISRHCTAFIEDTRFFSEDIARDEIVSKIDIPVKINSLVTKDTDILAVLKRWSPYSNARIAFRADYRNITLSSLKDLQDEITAAILSIPEVTYIGHSGCDVCFDVSFLYKNTQYFSYHRGLENSSIRFGDELIINDILVSQDGKLYYNWDQEISKLKIKKKRFIAYKEEKI